MTLILGLHVSHDSSACLLRNGALELAVQEERLTRQKFHDGFPRESIKHIIAAAGVRTSDLTIAIAGQSQHIENPLWVYLADASNKQTPRQLLGRVAAKFESMTGANVAKQLYFSQSAYRGYIRDELAGLGLDGCPVQFFDHHTCHAATAFFPTPYQTALVITQDGRGDGLSGSVSVGEGASLKRLVAQPSGDSLAQLYAGVTKHLGFIPLRHEGKITGLAAFGRDTPLREQIEALFHVDPSGRLGRLSARELRKRIRALSLSERERKLINAGPEEYSEFDAFGILFQHWLAGEAEGMSREDVSFAIQMATENVMMRSISRTIDAIDPAQPVNIGLAGGLFANVKLNQRIRELDKRVGNVFVQPAMGDCGLSVGAALLAHVEMGGSRCEPLEHVYLGNDYDEAAIEQLLRRQCERLQVERVRDSTPLIARIMAQGEIVGWFNGPMEFGPRALGSRSIILHPGKAEMNDIVNKRLNRSEFMPFAPSVLDTRAADYFKGYRDDHITTDWMTITYDVYEEKRAEIAAVVHVDGTARPQVVRERTNPAYYRILKEFEKLTGIGCIVNTSFNMHEEPIVASPEDALRAFDLGSVDVLALGNFLVRRK